jgi:aldose 1-epimerase
MSIITRNLVSLGDGIARCDVLPEAGGAVAGFWWERGGTRLDWLRPASGAALAGADPCAMGCFPLVPWGNRIRDGRFHFCGRDVRLESDDPHALHGHGWRRAWHVADRGTAHVALEYRHEADEWPWPYTARQTVSLEHGCLGLTIELTNHGDEIMPAGLGFHPYFPLTPQLALQARTRGLWRTDPERLPCAHEPPPPALAAGANAASLALDTVLTGWDGRAELTWPERRCRLALEASWPILSFLAIYLPDARDYLCVEPMSHCADAINIARQGGENTGLRVLAPGMTRRASVRFTPSSL